MSEEKQSQHNTLIRGTMWFALGDFLSKFMGAVYIIPWYAWMGEYGAQANALFSMGYVIYGIFLNISTAGLNVAVSKEIASYNSTGRKNLSYQLVYISFRFMLMIGLVFGVAMYLGAPWLAKISGADQALIPVIHSLSWAVLIFPAMSIVRGTFQGLNNVKPVAISQVLEQLIRVIWMLLTTFFIMKIGSGDYTVAVTQSTFAAFLGMLASVGVLLYYLKKSSLLGEIVAQAKVKKKIDAKPILINMVKAAIPFVITGSAIQIFQLIDQFTFINTMKLFTAYSTDDLKVLLAYFSANPNKIITLMLAVTITVGSIGIPLLTENYHKKDQKASAELIENSITMLTVFLFPAVMGVILLAKPVYVLFYGIPDQFALSLFVVSVLTTFIAGFYSFVAPTLQALFESRNAVRYFFYGAVIKLILQLPFIYLFHSYGPLLSTAIALTVSVILMYRRMHKVTQFDQSLMINRFLSIALQTLVMAVVVLIVELILTYLYPVNSRVSSLVHLIVSGGIGVVTYGIMSLATHSVDYLIGKEKALQLRRRLNLN